MSETAKALDARLSALFVTFAATGGERTKREDWECYAWRVQFKRPGKQPISTEYFCGLAHVKRGDFLPPRPIAPSAADVLHSLLSDGAAIDQSFDDWCADFGYDSDSRKAFATYEACCAIGRQLRAFFTHAEREELRTLLQDY